MGDAKKYYWLKLKDGFFADPKIKKLRKIAGGDTFTIILQKIMLLSIKDGGALEFQHIEPTFAEELALILDEDVENVKVTLSFMQINGLIEAIGEEEFFLPNVPPLIGSETDSAERVRRFREKQKALETPKQALQCNGEVTTSNIEKEKREKRKEIELDTRDKTKDANAPFSFSLSRDTHYDNLSAEYKVNLKSAIEALGLSLSHDDFVAALQSKSSYKYKNFVLAYKNWAKKDFNQGKRTTQYDGLVSTGQISKEVANTMDVLERMQWD